MNEANNLQIAENPTLVIPDVSGSTVFNYDCIAIMKQYPDKIFDLAVVDKINMFLLLLCQSIFVSLYQIKNI